jgi:hypothetical protein
MSTTALLDFVLSIETANVCVAPVAIEVFETAAVALHAARGAA